MAVISSFIIALTLVVWVFADSAEYAKLGSGGSRATSCRCGWRNHPQSRIVGGEESGVNEWPMIAALMDITDKSNIYQNCGATIVTNRHVISAAHCFRYTDPKTQLQMNKNPDTIAVLISAHNWLQSKDIKDFLEVESFDVHENYNHDNLDYDVAIVTVRGVIPMSPTVGPACFPSYRMAVNGVNQADVIAVGWGMTSYFGADNNGVNMGDRTTTLRKVHLTAYDINTCVNTYPNLQLFNLNDPHQFCTYNPGKSICPGDSGGPLFWYDPEINRYVLVGITSFVPRVNPGTPGCQDLSGFVDTSAFIGWVQSKIGVQTLCQKL